MSCCVFETGLLGLLLLGLLAADAAAWMIPGAISNLTHRESWIATILPSALAVSALPAAVGVVGSLVARRSQGSGSRGPAAVIVAACLLLVVSSVAGVVGRGGRSMRKGDLSVTTRNVKFSKTGLAADTGRIGVTVENRDLFWHTFTIRKLGVNLKVPVQAERRVSFRATPGVYEFVCAIPGHEQAGMKGTLTVR